MATTMSTQSIIDHLDRNVVILWVLSLIYPHFVRAIGLKNLLVFIIFCRQHSMTTRSELIIRAPGSRPQVSLRYQHLKTNLSPISLPRGS
jgi:hypothetical protein